MNKVVLSFGVLFLIVASANVRADALDELALDFWEWRAANKPNSEDDIDRIERPEGWVPDWSGAAVEKRKVELKAFRKRWEDIETTDWPVNRSVDYHLVGSAISRVEWELEVEKGWQRNPIFYIQQSIGPIFEELVVPPPFNQKRSEKLIRLMGNIPELLRTGRPNLAGPAIPFVQLAIAQLRDIRNRLQFLAQDLGPMLPEPLQIPFSLATQRAILGLEAYRDALAADLRRPAAAARPERTLSTAIGREAYEFYLRKVALLPYSPEQLVEMSRQEWDRAVAFQKYAEIQNRDKPVLPLIQGLDEQLKRVESDEKRIREFLETAGILSVPGGIGHYRFREVPKYLKMIEFLGVTDDLTGPSRSGENSTRYVDPPSEELPFFSLSAALDPRPLIVHEGFPGHYFQLALSWNHPDPLRRHYYDSTSNEGIAFYAEEMLLQAGLFEDSPRTSEIVYNYMRLRALRVEVDVKLALGEMTILEAADYLKQNVPMDEQTARFEAAFFASTPGQAISYQIGKLQILEFLAEARKLKNEEFDLRSFHDYLWKNGNVPLVLQRWEYLGLDDQIASILQ